MRIICQQIVVGLVVFIALRVYALYHSKYIAICSIYVDMVENFDRLDLFFFFLFRD